jgi:hypothetical protein
MKTGTHDIVVLDAMLKFSTVDSGSQASTPLSNTLNTLALEALPKNRSSSGTLASLMLEALSKFQSSSGTSFGSGVMEAMPNSSDRGAITQS